MASAQDPKLIKISQGDHSLSPHVTSLRSDVLHAISEQKTNKVAAPLPVRHTPAAIELNLIIPKEKINAALVQRVKEAEEKSQKQAAQRVHTFSLPRIPRVSLRFSKKQTPPKAKASMQPSHSYIAVKKIHASVVFMLIACLLVTPLKAITTYERLTEAKDTVEQLKTTAAGQMGSDFSQVNNLVTDALRSFHNAQDSLSHIDPAEEFVLRHTPVFGDQFGVASRMVAAGEHTSLAAASYMQLFRTLKLKSDAPLIERLNIFFEGNRAVLSDLTAAADLVQPIDTSSLPEDQQKLVSAARDSIIALHNDAEYLASAGPVILSTLGSTTARRYLIVFQNPTELRPTGGFIGSFALVDVENGEIKNLQVPAGGSYDLQGTLKKHVHAPLPLHIINSRWEFQDGNWFPDFPTSAKKLMWFLEKSQGPSVDGVIALNATLLPELLAVVGPVHVNGETNLSADNALSLVRDSINTAAASKDTKPKQIITSAAPAVIETLKAGKAEHFLPVITTLLKALEHRDIQLYARDAELERQIAEFGWDGALRDNPNGDYLSVIGTNIGGQKTDAVVHETIDHQAKIAPDGTVTVTVRVQRSQERSNKSLEDAPNVSYMRYYVPQGSKLVTAKGFVSPPETLFQAAENTDESDTDLQQTERDLGTDPASGTRVTEEFGHTVFGNWMITSPGTSAESVISYILPFKVEFDQPEGLEKIAAYIYKPRHAANYSLYIQRQSGLNNAAITSRVILPENWSLGWVTDSRAQVAENGALLSLPFLTDIHYGITAYAENNTTQSTSQEKN